MLWWEPDTPCPYQPRSCQTSESFRKKTRHDLPEASPRWLLKNHSSLSKGPINLWSNNSLYSFTRKCHQCCLLEASGTHDFHLSPSMGFFKCSWNGLCNHTCGLPWWPSSKEYTCNTGDLGSIPGSGRCPEEGNRNPLQYSCLGNPKERGAWWATVHGVTKESDMTEKLNKNSSSKITHLRSAHFGVKAP